MRIRLRRRSAAVVIATVSMTLLVAAACLGLIDVMSPSLSSSGVDDVGVSVQRSANDLTTSAIAAVWHRGVVVKTFDLRRRGFIVRPFRCTDWWTHESGRIGSMF